MNSNQTRKGRSGVLLVAVSLLGVILAFLPGKPARAQTTGGASAALAIDDVSLSEGNLGTTSAVFTITRSGATTGTSSATWATADRTALATSDYVAQPGTTVSFAAGQTTQTVSVAVRGDSAVEATETFVVKLREPVDAEIADETGLGTIANDDTPFASVEAGDDHTCGVRTDSTVACWGRNGYGQATPPAGNFTQVTAGDVHSCGLHADGTVACWGYDGHGQSRPPGGSFTELSAQHHTCGVRTDAALRCWGWNYFGQAIPPAGTFTHVSTGQFHTCALRTDGTVLCWGSNYDGQVTPPAGSFTQVTGGWSHACAIRTDGTVACWGSNRDGEATPPAGSFTRLSAGNYHTCGLRPDRTVSCWGQNGHGQATPPGGSFTHVSAGLFHTCALRTNGTVACWGHNGYGQGTPAPTLTVGDVTVAEGNGGTSSARFTVRLSAPAASSVTVVYATANGTATAPADYASASGTLTFAAGETWKTVSVTVKADVVDEARETYSLVLSNPTGTTIADDIGVGTIRDDEVPTLAVGDVVAVEGNGGTARASFSVRLSAPTASSVTVVYATANGTATAPADYASASGTLTFAAGETWKTVSVTVKADVVDEPDETYSLVLSNPTGATIADATGVGTIRDDDPAAGAPTLAVGDAVLTEGEGGVAKVTLTVRLSAPAASSVTVAYATANGTAAAPADYTSKSGTLGFAAGETWKTVSVTVNGDTVDEPDETYLLQLSNPTGATIADATGVGTIRDDDLAPALALGDAVAVEGDGGGAGASFTVRLSDPAASTVTVVYAISAGTAAAPADYTDVSGTLTFAAGEKWKIVSVTVNGDMVDEADETYFLELSNPMGATIADATGVGTIRDDD